MENRRSGKILESFFLLHIKEEGFGERTNAKYLPSPRRMLVFFLVDDGPRRVVVD